MKTEEKDLHIYWAEDRCRFELLDRRKVIIERQDLKKIWVLTLEAKTYTVKAYEPMFRKAKLSIEVTREKPKPRYPQIFPFDPTLFEVPPDFKASV